MSSNENEDSTNEKKESHQILRLPDVRRTTGLSRSTIYSRMDQGTFPRQVKLGVRAVGWLEKEIQDWVRRQIKASRKKH